MQLGYRLIGELYLFTSMLIYLILRKSDGGIFDAYQTEQLARKSIEVSISRMEEQHKEFMRKEYIVLPLFVKDKVDHL